MVDGEWNRHGEGKGKPTPGSGLVESNKTTPVFKLSVSWQGQQTNTGRLPASALVMQTICLGDGDSFFKHKTVLTSTSRLKAVPPKHPTCLSFSGFQSHSHHIVLQQFLIPLQLRNLIDFKIYFYFVCKGVLSVYMCTICMLCLRMPEEGIRSTSNVITVVMSQLVVRD